MNFLQTLMGGSAQNLQFGNEIGSAIGQFGAAIHERGVEREREQTYKATQETRRMVAEINTKRAAREARYQLGLARVANRGDLYSNSVFQAAENARSASEAVSQEMLAFELSNTEYVRNEPDLGLAGIDFLTGVTGAFARRNARRAAREV